MRVSDKESNELRELEEQLQEAYEKIDEIQNRIAEIFIYEKDTSDEAADIDKSEIQIVLEEVVTSVTSFDFATSIVYLEEKQRGDLYNIYENIKVTQLKKLLSSRLHKYFIKKDQDIFKEEKNWAPILSRWTLYDSETKKQVNEYVFSLIEKKPTYLGKIINSFTIHFERHPQFDYESLATQYNKDKIYQLIKEKGAKAYSNEDEKKSIDFFTKRYEKEQSGINNGRSSGTS